MMISKAMNEKLNGQVAAEFNAAHQYLAMACAFEAMGYKILAQRFIGQHEEELSHAMKIVHYMQEVGGDVVLGSVASPQNQFETVEQIVQAALDSELNISGMINDTVTLAEQEKDHATRSFLGWFVDEQVEEVSSMNGLLQLVKLAKGNILLVENRVRHEMVPTGSGGHGG